MQVPDTSSESGAADLSSFGVRPPLSPCSFLSEESWSTQATGGSPVKSPQTPLLKISKRCMTSKTKNCIINSAYPTETSEAKSSDRPDKRRSPDVKTSNKKARVADGEEFPVDIGWGWRIPAELLHQVFSFLVQDPGAAVGALHRLSRVCKLWSDIALSPLLWRTVDLRKTRKKYRTQTHLRWLLENRLQGVRQLSLGSWPSPKIVNARTLSELCTACPELAHLELDSPRVNLAMLMTVAEQAPRLVGLSVSQLQRSVMTAASLRQLMGVVGSRLTSLSLCNTTTTGMPGVLTVLTSDCPALEQLDLSNINTFMAPVPLSVRRLQEGCPRLRVLSWSNTNITLSCDQQGPLPGLPLLEEFSAAVVRDSGYSGVTDSGMAALLGGSARLRLLDLRGCLLATGSGLRTLPATDVQYLYLTGCLDLEFTGLGGALCRWCHSLLELDLSFSGSQDTVDAVLLAFCSADLPAEEEAGQMMRTALGSDVLKRATACDSGRSRPLRELVLRAAPVSLSAVRCVLAACGELRSLDLTSIRELPRGMKLLYSDIMLENLRNGIDSIVRRNVECRSRAHRV